MTLQSDLVERLTNEFRKAPALGPTSKIGRPTGEIVDYEMLAEIAVEAIASQIETLRGALERIALMTDIETDFDGFEARDIAIAALKGTGEDNG